MRILGGFGVDKSEKLLNAISQLYFYEELQLENSCYFPEENPRQDLPDLILNLGNSMVVVKLAVREDPSRSDTWVNDTCRTERMVMQEILSRVQAGTLPAFRNRRGERAELSKTVTAFPILVLDNGDREEKYPPLLEKYSPEALIVNCMLLKDFQRLCGTLTMPMELLHFLYYRACFYGDLETVTRSFQGKLQKDQPVGEVDLIYEFLADKYGYYKSNIRKFRLEDFRAFLKSLPDHRVMPEGKTQGDLLAFFSHLARGEIAAFLERMDMLSEEVRRNSGGLLSSLRPKDDRYAIFFVARDSFPLPVLRQMIYGCDRVSEVLEVVGRRKPDGTVALEFLLNDRF